MEVRLSVWVDESRGKLYSQQSMQMNEDLNHVLFFTLQNLVEQNVKRMYKRKGENIVTMKKVK
jgi:hypothetical protein